MKLTLPLAVLRAYQQTRRVPGAGGTIAIGGASELVPILAKELRAGGEDAAVTENRADGQPSAIVWIGKSQDGTLRAASRAGIPIVGVTDGESLPYVLDTNLVRALPGRPLPVQEIAAALAHALGHQGASIAARLPVLRPHVLRELARKTTRLNAIVGAAPFLPGSDLPVLTMNEALMVLRMAVTTGRHGEPAKLWPELAGVAGVGFAARQLTRELEALPVWGFVVKGTVAAVGTAALGEVLRRRFA